MNVVEIIVLLLIIIFICSLYIFAMKDKISMSTTFLKKDRIQTIISSIICILFGIIIGFIILIIIAGKTIGNVQITWNSTIDAMQLLLLGIFCNGRNELGQLIYGWNGSNLGNVLFKAMPLILCGLSVAVAFKTGLFNIGTPGQYLIGAAITLIVALSIPSQNINPFIIWILSFIAGTLGGALWGFIPGILKSNFNINEVITGIMTNWISANVVTLLFDKEKGPFNYLLDASGSKNYAYVYKSTYNNVYTIKGGLDKLFAGSQVNIGILIAVFIAIIIYIVIEKTTLGFELKACGSNRLAAKYAGINEKRNIILSMVIAGGLAGAAASLYYLSGNTEFKWETYQMLPEVAFNGIPVALIAMNSPIGVIFSAIFMASLDINGMQIKYYTNYNEYITAIISAIIVYTSAFILIIKNLIKNKIKKRSR